MNDALRESIARYICTVADRGDWRSYTTEADDIFAMIEKEVRCTLQEIDETCDSGLAVTTIIDRVQLLARGALGRYQ